MASSLAIAAVADAIKRLFDQQFKQDHPNHPVVTSLTVQLTRGQDIAGSTAISPGTLLVFIPRVVPNLSTRNRLPEDRPSGKRYYPSLPVDIHFVLLPVLKSAAVHYEFLGWIYRTLDDHPVLPAGFLNAGALGTVFAPDEFVEIHLEAPSMSDYVAAFEVNKTRLDAGVSCVARAVSLESTRQIETHPEVQVQDWRFETWK
ncbi:Pvc16 family protein [Deinococcus cellulosilyticus]|uniref:Pvc16 N-terminal domain-containing protein n=1 Tax=Deinococcus cellulosilyticus (strain DSM 18568 / NBRC 106333 / KACC 11606 / 5516J-15) TaxID=1223518 RepID=A0A511N0M9_DEIC1|nr:Pvc16 family protein [Deinococcus cellulosilyticus]GEM46007.1 hypothetical protein DC3_16420 [Deinococcus cellulosilyticus NBRC 106333 = KACC 11606]